MTSTAHRCSLEPVTPDPNRADPGLHPLEVIKEEVAHTARMIAAAGLVDAFGHVSARLPGECFLLTSTAPMFSTTSESIVTVRLDGEVLEDPTGAAPLETPLHAALYRERRDVNAICRGHGPAMVAWGVGTLDIPLLHGLGALAGSVVPVHPEIALIASKDLGEEVANTLGNNLAVLLCANGGLAVGSDLLEAATRLWFVEERARVALSAHSNVQPSGDWDARVGFTPIEMSRAKAWFHARFFSDSKTSTKEY